MNHREKVNYVLADLDQRGVKRYYSAPPLWRVAWAIGIPLRPPHFMGFLPATLFNGGYFGFAWGALMWLLVWRSAEIAFAATAATAAGALFGLFMGVYYRRSAAKLQLPPWERYPMG
jgi:hypothetical protein